MAILQYRIVRNYRESRYHEEGEVKGESSEVSHSVIAIECDASYRTVHKDCIRLTIW